jgi:tetratricopeptide (TPR) repeat protein
LGKPVIRAAIHRRKSVTAIAVLATFLCLTPAPPAAASTAADAFEDGNRLFRDDLYWAALLRYRQAGELGMDTPLLHYNSGVAHYRAQQHIRARTALLKAAQSPSLRVISQYNLGLNAYALGDVDDALSWFRQARDQQENEIIRQFAIVAISRLQAERRASDTLLVRSKKRRKEQKIGDFDLRATIGFGSDSNVYRSPSQTYIDFSDPDLPIVTPVEASGTYLPVDLSAKYSVHSLRYESFFGEYRLSGRYYQDKELDNANEFSHELRFGSEFDRKEGSRTRKVYSAFTIAQHDETFFDPDDGTARTVDGELIDDRLNYVRYGPEMSFRQSHERFSIGMRLKGQLWNYQKTDVVPEYDHEYFALGVNTQYRFTRTSLLRLTVDASSRRFGDRPSFDLNGQQLITNKELRYDYLDLGLIARQRITDNMWFGFGYERTSRTDKFVGYNDYTRDSYKFEFSWSPGDRFDLDLDAYYRNYSFPNAFAFNNPVAGPKTLETAYGSLTGTYRMTQHLLLVAEVLYRESVSTDTRIGYDRKRYSLGVVWRQ